MESRERGAHPMTDAEKQAIPRTEVATADSTASQSAKIAAVVAFYFFVSISLVFLNKYLMRGYDFNYPIFITWYQQVVSIGCIAIAGEVGKRVPSLSFLPSLEWDSTIARGVAPLTCVFVMMLAFNNLCLRFVEVWFYQVARSLSILFSIIFTYVFLGERTSRLSLAACGVVIVGFLVGAIGRGGGEATEKKAGLIKFLGIAFGLLSSVFVALYGIFVKRKLPLVGNNEWRLLNYNTLISCVFLLPLIVIAQEMSFVSNPLMFSPRFWFDMTVTGALGFLIAIAIFMQVKVTSPLTNTISGTAKACTQTLLAVVIWGSKVSFESWLGIFMVIGGSFWYSMIRFQEMQRKRQLAAESRAPAPAVSPVNPAK